MPNRSLYREITVGPSDPPPAPTTPSANADFRRMNGIEWHKGDKCNVKGWRRKYVGTIDREPSVDDRYIQIIIDGQWRIFPREELSPIKQYILKPGNKRRTKKKDK